MIRIKAPTTPSIREHFPCLFSVYTGCQSHRTPLEACHPEPRRGEGSRMVDRDASPRRTTHDILLVAPSVARIAADASGHRRDAPDMAGRRLEPCGSLRAG